MNENLSNITSGHGNACLKMKPNVCLKCEVWNRTAIEAGYASGMCKECFDERCVAVDLSYDDGK